MTYPWHHHPSARSILAHTTAAHVYIKVVTPVVGPREYAWSAGGRHEDLEQARVKIFRQFHGTYQEAYERGEADKHCLMIAELYPTVEQVLADKFGDPAEMFGVPDTFEVQAVRVNSLWKQMQEKAA